jgi:hypothetical protein
MNPWLLVLVLVLVLALDPAPVPPAAGAPPPDVAAAIADVEARLERALRHRDRAALDAVVATPFTWVHASDGRTDTRDVWLASAAQGSALTGQRVERSEHGPSLAAYGTPQPHTVVRVARVRLLDATGGRESWIRQTHVLVRDADGAWRLALGQGVLMYEGPPLDAALHARYAGTYVISPGRQLVLAFEDGALFATFPNGGAAQVFLASPTEEASRTLGAGRLRFTLGPDGRPVAAALVRGDREVWRATRTP